MVDYEIDPGMPPPTRHEAPGRAAPHAIGAAYTGLQIQNTNGTIGHGAQGRSLTAAARALAIVLPFDIRRIRYSSNIRIFVEYSTNHSMGVIE